MVVRAASMLPARLLLNWLEMFGLKWILGRQWPTTADDLMVYDLSSRAYIPLLVLLWMPAQACVTLLSLWQIGVLGGCTIHARQSQAWLSLTAVLLARSGTAT